MAKVQKEFTGQVEAAQAEAPKAEAPKAVENKATAISKRDEIKAKVESHLRGSYLFAESDFKELLEIL